MSIERDIAGMRPGTIIDHSNRFGDALRVPHSYFEQPIKIDGWKCTFVARHGIDRKKQAVMTYRRVVA